MKPFISTIAVTAKQALDGGVLSIIRLHMIKFISFIFMMQIWRVLGADENTPMTVDHLITYSLFSTAFRQQMDIITPATSSLWEGSVLGRYLRPMPVFASFIAETIGKWWIPSLLFFTIPLIIFSHIGKISVAPASIYTGIAGAISLCLSASLGFAMDFIFAAFAIRLKNAMWAATKIRETILNLLSGGVIPFAMMPALVGGFLSKLPFSYLSSTPINIYLGLESPLKSMLMQIVWNIVFWIGAFYFYQKSEEGLVSYGG